MTSVFVLVDALGWELIRDRPFLEGILPHRQEVTTIFGFSSAAIPSILTGLLPRGHGHWNLFLYDPRRSPFRWARFLHHLPNRWANHRAVRKAVAIIGRKVSRSTGHFQIYGVPVQLLPLFDICEKDDIYKPGGLHPARSIFDRLKESGVPHRVYSYHQFSDREAVAQAVRDLGRREARFYFVYLAELDAFLHHHVQEPERIAAELDRYDREIRRLYDAALAADPEAAFYVFSDHGMTPTARTFDLMGAVGKLNFAAPKDYVALYDATMARFWFFNPAARQAITALLGGLDCGHIVGAAEQAKFGIDFEHNRFGDLIFLMEPGCLMHPSHMGRVPMRGMHGFHPGHRSSSAALLSRRPPALPVERIPDLFALMCREAGIA